MPPAFILSQDQTLRYEKLDRPVSSYELPDALLDFLVLPDSRFRESVLKESGAFLPTTLLCYRIISRCSNFKEPAAVTGRTGFLQQGFTLAPLFPIASPFSGFSGNFRVFWGIAPAQGWGEIPCGAEPR